MLLSIVIITIILLFDFYDSILQATLLLDSPMAEGKKLELLCRLVPSFGLQAGTSGMRQMSADCRKNSVSLECRLHTA